jgi:formylglycine-generating enzyme required for sulfatase activity/cellulose biosynthesis protein BcsQ
MQAPGTVITFYSFKGGVGRSMAVANLAVLLARAGKRVLCLDWDLEAPGLDRYFRSSGPAASTGQPPSLTDPLRKGGLLRIFEASSVDKLENWREYIQTRIGTDGTSLDIIGSGDNAHDYSSQLSAFSWAEYFSNRQGSDIIEQLRLEWKTSYDYVLVDSRTGLTDASGICSIQMPDVLLMFFAANDQNTDWSGRVARSIREGRRSLRYDRPFLLIVPILSRFDAREESDRASAAMDRIATMFEPLYADWLPTSVKPRDALPWISLPYTPRYSFQEALAVEDEPEAGAQGLSFYYDLLSRLILARFQLVREILGGVGVPGAAPASLLPSNDELRRVLESDSGAINRYRNALKGKVEDDPLAAAQAFESLATIALTSHPSEAAKLFEEAARIYQLLGDDAARVAVLGKVARLEADAGHFVKALGLHQMTLSVFDRIGDTKSRDSTLEEIARLRFRSRGVESVGVLAPLSSVFLERGSTTEWRSTLSFLFGRLVSAYAEPRKAVDLFEVLLDQASDSDEGLSLVVADAAQILTGRGIALNAPTLRRLQGLLLRGMRGSEPVARRADIGSALGLMGDPRFQSDRWSLAHEDLLGFIKVAPGEFLIGSDPLVDRHAKDDEQPQHTVSLAEYYVARYPVTIGQFRAFVEDTGFQVGDRDCLRGVPNHPVVRVGFEEALAYCDWLTERLKTTASTPQELLSLLTAGWTITLPSEVEWEAAARGTDGRLYPWGNEFDSSNCNGYETGLGTTSTVGLFVQGASPCGALDMSGNVWEWTRSPWSSYPREPGRGEPKSHDVAEDAALHVLRGGGAHATQEFVRSACRVSASATIRASNIGFRLAGRPPEV